VLDPDLVVRLHPRVRVGLVDDVHLVPAELATAPRGADGIGDGRGHIRIGGRQQSQADRHRGGDRLVIDAEGVCVDAFRNVLGPGLHIARRTALEQDEKTVAAKSSAEVRRRELHSEQVGELRHEILARQDADRMLKVGEPVGLDVRELPDAALDADGAALADGGYEVTLLQEVCGGIVLYRLVQARFKVQVLLVIGGMLMRVAGSFS